MANLLVDPNTLVAPDFTLEAHARKRQTWLAAGLTEEQVLAALAADWQAENDHDKLVWQERTAAEAQAAREQAVAAEAAANQLREAERQEEAQSLKDEMKKNKEKYSFVPNIPTPAGRLVMAAPYAVRRLEKGLYIELYYYTNQGLRAAAADVSQVNDEGLVLKENSDGTTTLVQGATLRQGKSVIPDCELTWAQLREAVTRLIPAMQRARWAPARVEMLALFWGNLETHDFQQSIDPIDVQALVVYQAEQRMRWHQAIVGDGGGWNLSILSEEALEETRDRVYRRDRNAQDADVTVSNLVSLSCATEQALTIPPFLSISTRYTCSQITNHAPRALCL
ncbi:uncharacterized protein B0H18DRAFT_877772 [Fomitopsis serialis]|uniref:uncharacterized protein n=1 Tax=Fomitopsis serialis TaxID=139415 RepID=UPI002008755B|nr:uncharacterized protein B0H18DRAFT_877772 [Neoantrodia serialis]KAH9924513.1 hypothetical protein B0H18DRAFT_877772 [Neoantrodia serialis]